MIRAGAAGKILETPRLSFVNGYHVRLVTQRTRACDRQRACKVKSSAVVEGEEQRMLRFFADSVKTVTLAAACTSIAVKRDASMIVYFIGALGISILVKTLKMIINESRPTDKKKSSSGMPSSHATVLCFLSAYLALDIWNANSLAPFASIGLLLMTAAGSIVRVVVGYHTWAQVAVGAALGSLGGVGWHRFAKAIALPALDSVATQEVLNLLSVLILLSGGFIFYQRDIFKKKSEADRAREQ
mmetsp:Transcript_15948/g.65396  ORF Transcript_15948/g.65396 Transcript_15948/m.65396 type:complete len:243 (-) Transcript_15948:4237-4965(-)|eukprot:CAMPEP_0113970244 /NCGR_PEP_ID=MMETSP0011_2-20120614/11005_1 /TAXON_ID=101924 /ORGANISM="Rhodosorus marinus" /LENGTH=242 /DNA_ID=CAMNT_0000984471 /DNA_START=86 /DNA_END=814 /DNA_ORIENTATION=+ /assembly_acc=CAM_ASM_000156